jgi:hypothetical protein
VLGAQMNEGVIALVLYGTPTFDVANVDRSTLKLRRIDNVGTTVPVGITKLVDRGRPGTEKTPNCSSPVKDGRLDLQLVYSYDAMKTALNMDVEKPGTSFDVAITGRLIDGRYFTIRDNVTTSP